MAGISSAQCQAMLDTADENEKPFFQKLYDDAVQREREAEAAARATSIAEQAALLAVPELNDDQFREKIADAVTALVRLRTLEDLESRVTALEQRNQERQAEILSLKQSQLSTPRPPNPQPAAVLVSQPNTVLLTRASGTVTSAGIGANSSSGSADSSALVIVPNAGTSAQNATVLTGVQYNGPVVDKRAATLPSKYDGKGDITSWISSMRSYFKVLRTPQEDRSMIMGTNTEPAVRNFIELQAVTAGSERIDLTEWLKVTPVRTLEDLLITRYQDKHAALKARLKLEALKGMRVTFDKDRTVTHELNFYVMDKCPFDAVIGLGWLKVHCLRTTWADNQFVVRDAKGNERTVLLDETRESPVTLLSANKFCKSVRRRKEAEHVHVALVKPLHVPSTFAAFSTSFGHPKTMTSDRDTRFITKDWKDFTSQIYDIKLNKTSGRHPEVNGLAEEINQTVIQLLRALIAPDQNTWDKELHKVKGLYNNSIHSATGVTPNQLQYGWQLRNPLSYLFPERSPGLMPGMPGYNAKYGRLLKAAIAAMNKRQHAMIKHVNKSHKEANFKVGDYVWVKMSEFSDEEGVSRKLLPLYYGPWQVLKVIGDDFGPSYVIDVPPHLHTYPVFHASKLFPHIDDETFPFRDPMIPLPIDDGHEIDRIVSHEGRGRNKQYKVHFLYHPLNEFFWIDRKELLKNAPRVVNAYGRQITDGQTISILFFKYCTFGGRIKELDLSFYNENHVDCSDLEISFVQFIMLLKSCKLIDEAAFSIICRGISSLNIGDFIGKNFLTTLKRIEKVKAKGPTVTKSKLPESAGRNKQGVSLQILGKVLRSMSAIKSFQEQPRVTFSTFIKNHVVQVK
ncbi:hypothetical protein CBR_g12220 [Chara braunii]|uniref:Integrase catalytic domain-containing protein n=1 Tax=Chara braunii TaxID=69332 RepID=A0A388KRI1_CHABU|nr:hypothetical protein CBR_g12220 [Chara braunii]|eukprot:GBG72646.1 hypothetical protein CBR_g12220 [Chara braunii]